MFTFNCILRDSNKKINKRYVLNAESKQQAFNIIVSSYKSNDMCYTGDIVGSTEITDWEIEQMAYNFLIDLSEG